MSLTDNLHLGVQCLDCLASHFISHFMMLHPLKPSAALSLPHLACVCKDVLCAMQNAMWRTLWYDVGINNHLYHTAGVFRRIRCCSLLNQAEVFCLWAHNLAHVPLLFSYYFQAALSHAQGNQMACSGRMHLMLRQQRAYVHVCMHA